jgi:large subunit ribosomal protein L5
MSKDNIMRTIKISKLTLNVGAGKDQKVLEKGVKLIKHITGLDPVKTITNKRLQAWGLRPGLPIGCKITIRDQDKIHALINRLLDAKEFTLSKRQFDKNGNIAFGITEYIDIGETEYNPEIGMMGLEVCITLQRPGFRIRDRRIKSAKIPNKHRITQDESISFMKDNFKVQIKEEVEAQEGEE